MWPAPFRTVVVLLVVLAGCSFHPQAFDPAFEPAIDRPAYGAGEGPVVLIDEGHYNFHTMDGRYRPFADLLRRDGYVVDRVSSALSSESLGDARVLVIANALARENETKWKLPTPSAFTDGEIEALSEWVSDGGALFLIADHMPFPGAAEKLAAAFEIYFTNGYAYDSEHEGHIVFERSDGSLAGHPITEGRDAGERVASVKTFGGQAFRATREVTPLLLLPAGSRISLPIKAGKFSEKTPQVPATGLYQGAVFEHGRGRVAVFGEAAMFSAQVLAHGKETFSMGMNAEGAEQNPQFLLNVVHWLSGLID